MFDTSGSYFLGKIKLFRNIWSIDSHQSNFDWDEGWLKKIIELEGVQKIIKLNGAKNYSIGGVVQNII